MISLNSKIINLRPIEISDLRIIKKWRNSRDFQPYFREYREFSQAHIEDWYNSMIFDDKFEFFLVEDESKNPIGVTGFTYINWINKHADIHIANYEHGWVDDFYSPETLSVMLDYGFNYLNFNKIYAEVYEIDKKKLTFFNSNNFKNDAILRQHYFFKGEYINSHILSLLRSEYGKRKQE